MDEREHLRASDADRERVAEILRTAAGEGRIDADELDDRLGAAYTAKTVGDLVPLTSDLPGESPYGGSAHPVPAAGLPSTQPDNPVVANGVDHQSGVAIMSGFDRRGRWLVPRRMTVTALMGGARLDTRTARFSADEVVIHVNAVMGGVDVVVGPRTRVIVEGIGIMGAFDGPRDDSEVDDASPTVRVKGFAFWGGVAVKRRELDEP